MIQIKYYDLKNIMNGGSSKSNTYSSIFNSISKLNLENEPPKNPIITDIHYSKKKKIY